MNVDENLLLRLESTLEHLARESGAILMSYFGQLEAEDIGFKGRRDLLTVADQSSESFLVKEIGKAFPGHSILAEESAETSDWEIDPGAITWVVDPLDGTTNFVHGHPMFAVSIGVLAQGEPIAGCVYAPRLEELFLAVKGRGARLEGNPIGVSGTGDLMDAMLTTGFAYQLEEKGDDNLGHFTNLVKKTRAVRRCGSAAIDLAYTACGRYDGFWELHLSPWDVAAGCALVREAGGRVTDMDGGDNWLVGGSILASNEVLHTDLLGELGGG